MLVYLDLLTKSAIMPPQLQLMLGNGWRSGCKKSINIRHAPLPIRSAPTL
jgi:hypothetical protein